MNTAGKPVREGSEEDSPGLDSLSQADPVPSGVAIPSQVGASPATGWLQRTFASLRNRDYRIFFAGQTVSLVGTWMRMTAQGWLVYELTGSKLMLGTVTGLSLLPLFLFSTVAGALADRMPKRKLLIGAHAAMMAVSLTVALLIATQRIEVWHLVLAATLIGTAFAVDLPTRQSYYIQLVGRKDLLNAIALNSAAFNAARIVGPAVAGILMAALGIAACFFADAISYLAVIGSLLLIRTRESIPPADGRSHLLLLREGFAYVRENRRIKTLMLLLAVTGIFGWSYVALMPAFAQDVLFLSEAGYGALMSVNGLGALVGALFVAGRGENRDPRRQVFGGLWLFCLTLLGFSLVEHPVAAGAFIALAGAGLIAFISTSNTLIQLTVPDHLRGRVMGVWGLVFGGALPVGSFLMGAVAQRFGVVVAMASGALICLAASILVYLSLPARKVGPET